MHIVKYGDEVDNYPDIPVCTQAILNAGEQARNTQAKNTQEKLNTAKQTESTHSESIPLELHQAPPPSFTDNMFSDGSMIGMLIMIFIVLF